MDIDLSNSFYYGLDNIKPSKPYSVESIVLIKMGTCATTCGQEKFFLHGIPKILENSSKVTSKYRIINSLKTHTEEKFVYHVADILTKEEWIMKKYIVAHRSEQNVVNEIEVHKNAETVHVVKIHEYFKTDDCILVIYEKAPGKKLFNALSAQGEFDEDEFALIFHQLISVMAYLHEIGIMLRGVDPSNIMYDGSTLKFFNLSNAVFFKKGQKFKQKACPPLFVSPEMVRGKYTYKTDVWTIGVIAFILLTGTPHVSGENSAEIMLAIGKNQINMELLANVEMDPVLKDIIKSMLHLDPKTRPKFKHIKSTEWYKNFKVKRRSEFRRRSLFTKQLKEFSFRNNFIRTIHSYLVRQAITSEEKDRALHEFKKLDTNNDGIIDKVEFKIVLESLGFQNSDEITEEIFEKLDSKKRGSIDYQEFLDLWVDRKKFFAKDNLLKYFNILDSDKNGLITIEDLEKVFGSHTRSESFKQYFSKYSKSQGMDLGNFQRLIRDLRPVIQSSRNLEADISYRNLAVE